MQQDKDFPVVILVGSRINFYQDLQDAKVVVFLSWSRILTLLKNHNFNFASDQ